MANHLQAPVHKDNAVLFRNVVFVFGLVLGLLCVTLPFLRYLFFTVPFLVILALLADGKVRFGEEIWPFLAFIIAGLILSPLGNNEGIKDLFFIFAGVSISLLYKIPKVNLWTIFIIFFLGALVFFGLSGALTSGFHFDLANSESSFESPFGFIFGLLIPFALIEKRYRLLILSIVMAILCLKRIALLGAAVACIFVLLGEKRGRYLLNAWVMVPVNLVFVGILLFYGAGEFDYLIHEYTNQSANQFGMGRQELLSLPAKEIFAHPEQFLFWGRGPGASYELSKSGFLSLAKVNLHSDIIKIYYEYGLIFLSFMIALMYTAKNYAVRVGFVFLNTMFISDNTLIYYFLLFIFIYCVRTINTADSELTLEGVKS